MPALITHNLFGQEAALLLPQGLISSQEELSAFLLGNQGPDPLYGRLLGGAKKNALCHKLADLMHAEKCAETFLELFNGVARLPQEDASIGRAFVLGLLAHYTLDLAAHPFVFAQQYALAATDEAYFKNKGSELHGVIESELDSYMLWTYRKKKVSEFHSWNCFNRTDRIDRVSSALISYVAAKVYGLQLKANEFEQSVDDMELVYRLIDDPKFKDFGPAIRSLEKKCIGSQMLSALRHIDSTSSQCAAANLEHKAWLDPALKVERRESFPEIFFAALDAWPRNAEALIRSDSMSAAELQEVFGPRNYNGDLL